MHRRCIALILGMAILFCSIPVRIEQDGLAEEVLAQITAEPSEAHVSALATESPTESMETTDTPTPTAEQPSLAEETTAAPAAEWTTEPLPEPTVEPVVTAAPEATAVPTPEATATATIDVSPVPTETPIAETATPAPTAAPVYYCGLDEHFHVDSCYSADDLECLVPEHAHSGVCLQKPTPTPEPVEEATPSPTPESMEIVPVTESPTTAGEAFPAPTAEVVEETPLSAEIPVETSNVNVCGILEHIHTDKCYSGNNTLACTFEEHTHSDACLIAFDATVAPAATNSPVYYCDLIEHKHSDLCYSADQEMTCSSPEHEHAEECMVESESAAVPGETLQPSEFPVQGEMPSPTYYCDKPNHTHSEACTYPALSVEIATSFDSVAVNDELLFKATIAGGKAPYTIILTVAADSIMIHEETLSAEMEGLLDLSYQPTHTGAQHLVLTVADSLSSTVEAEYNLTVNEEGPELTEDWTKSFSHIQRTGDLRTDIVAIAKTQLGYAESETDFIYVDSAQKGYTRYGAWFGSPYEDWCAMFAAFCLHYAGAEDAFPLSGNVPEWIEAIQAVGLYRSAAEYLPMAGDLIFFDWDADGLGDHVGLVSETLTHSDQLLLELTTIEGNVENQVAYRQYQLPEDARIMGYGQIASNPVMQTIADAEALIAPIPPVDEVEEVIAALSGTDEETAYLMQLVDLCLTAWEAYEPLGLTMQSYVSNTYLLMDLEWLWSMHTLEEPTDGTSETPVERTDDLSTVGSSSGIRFRLFNYDANINSNGHKDVFGFRGVNKHDPEGDDTVINASLDADGYVANRAKVEPVLSNGYPVFDGRGVTSDFSLGYLFGAGGNGVTAYTPSNTPLRYNSSTNLYRYDSAQNAVDFDLANNRFIVRSYVERGDSTAAYGSGYADFMPFTYWNNATSYTHSSGAEYFYDSDKELDYWFGMTMDTAFFQPKGGQIGQDDMVFSFSGDDDVWVFIDDVLVLDLGGTHGVVTGSINFATGEITQHLDWAGSKTPSYPTTLQECFQKAGREPNGGWSEDGATFADYSKHTFKFFYLERGAGSSNCKLTFNLPTLPDESLIVTKELTGDSVDSETGTFIENSLSYAFRVMKVDSEGSAASKFFIQPGTSYTLLQDGASVGTGTVLEDGTFHLKAGQSARFDEMIEKGNGAVQYVVQEIMPDSLTGQYGGIEYEVSGAGGDTKTEEGPTEAFTAFQTAVLSAEESQIVTYRNKVATSNLSLLKLSKEAAPGSTFPTDQVFQLQVQLGDELLSAGMTYLIEGSGEVRTVAADGVIELKPGETAALQQGILSGTEYRITELGTETGDFNVTFGGTVTAADGATALTSSSGAVAGSFPLNSVVHVIAENASYDHAVEIPFTKQALGNQENASFSFAVEQGAWEAGVWTSSASLPGTTIEVSDDAATHGKIVIGYQSGTEGTFYYRISEQAGSDAFLYDDTYYIVEVTVADQKAAVSNVWRNGEELLDTGNALAFVNQKTVAVTIDKQVTGLSPIPADAAFDFMLSVDGVEGFIFPNNDSYEKINDVTIRFQLSHGQSITIPHVPVGATLTLSESGSEGYVTFHRIGNQDETSIGSVVTLNAVETPVTVSFINHGGYMLPATGGSGSEWYTMGGLCLLAFALLLYKTKRCWKGGY